MGQSRLDIKNRKAGTVEYRLWQFSTLCNKNAPHPRDWRRFYLFVVYAHQKRIRWDEYTFRSKLRELGFDDRHAVDFSNAYWHIRCALHMTKPRALTESYHAWMQAGGIPST